MDDNEKIILPSGLMAQKAVYNVFGIQEYDMNPFIQALPKFKDKEEIIRSLTIPTIYDDKDREQNSIIRVHMVHRIFNVFQPLPEHIKIWNMINTLIYQGYLSRNPMSAKYKRYLHETGKNIINNEMDIYDNSHFNSTASLLTIIGYSGMGKSRTVNLILNQLQQIIVHSEYNQKHFNHIQVTWLRLEAPHNGSLKALCLQYFMKLDELLGTNNFKKYVSRNLSVDAMLPLMGKVAQNIALGVLVLDELQHVVGKNAKQIMNFFVALTNTFGVPVVFIGTPAANSLFESEFRIARRAMGNGELVWNNMKNDRKFTLFLKGIWKYQWTLRKTELSQEIIDVFYDETQGISDLVIKLFVNVQVEVIETGKEVISEAAIRKVAKNKFKCMRAMLDAIKSNNPYKLMKFEDTYPIHIQDNLQSTNNQTDRAYINSKRYEKEQCEKNSIKRRNKKLNYRENDLRRLYRGNNSMETTYELLLNEGYIEDYDEFYARTI